MVPGRPSPATADAYHDVAVADLVLVQHAVPGHRPLTCDREKAATRPFRDDVSAGKTAYKVIALVRALRPEAKHRYDPSLAPEAYEDPKKNSVRGEGDLTLPQLRRGRSTSGAVAAALRSSAAKLAERQVALTTTMKSTPSDDPRTSPVRGSGLSR